MNTKTITAGIATLALGGAFLAGASMVNGQTYQKVSATNLQINTSVSTVVSLSDLKAELTAAQTSRQEEIDRSAARVAEFDAYIADHQEKISKAEQLGVQEESAPIAE